jgi:hypothetical protein
LTYGSNFNMISLSNVHTSEHTVIIVTFSDLSQL